jgi:hypothetical protein
MSEFDPTAWGAIPVDDNPVAWGAIPVEDKAEPISANNVARAAATGVPIIGGLLNKANAATNAALAPVLNPLFDQKDQLSEPTYAERYAHSLKDQEGMDKRFEEQHPVVSTAAQIAGGVGATLPLAATATGAKLLGITGETLAKQAGAGALSGAAIGAADSAARGQSMSEGAIIGLGMGAGAPIIGHAIGTGFQGAKNLISPPRAPSNFAEVALPAGGTAKVPLSTGQVRQDFDTVMAEQAALRGGSGQQAQHVAQEFVDKQRGALDEARSQISKGMDPGGFQVADGVHDAADIIGQGVRSAADIAKKGYQSAYDKFGTLPGEFESSAFERIGTSIRNRLQQGKEPVFVDEKLTPYAAQALKDVDHTLGGINIENAALPHPNPPKDTFSIQDMDLARKRLNAIYQDAKSSPNPSDRRAVSKIIGAFDDHVETALNSQLFTGDEAAYSTLKGARQAFSDYRKTFTPTGAGDEVGRVMQKITGKFDGQEATPTEIANYLFGASNIGAKGVSVRVADRIKSVLGDQSPEWSAVRQGLWSKLTAPAEGMSEFGSQKMSQRIFQFLNGDGKALAQKLYSPQELDAMRSYALTLKTVTPMPGTVNHSNTAPVLKKIAGGSAKHGAALLGLHAAGPAGAIAGYAASAVAKGLGARAAANSAARSYNGPVGQSAADKLYRMALANRTSAISRGALPALKND